MCGWSEARAHKMGADCGRGSAKAVDIYHPALLVSYQVGGPLTLTSSMKAAAMSGILSCMMNEISPCRIWTEFVAPMGRVVRRNKPRGIWKVVRSHDLTAKLWWSKATKRSRPV